jgi:hypothetical protein
MRPSRTTPFLTPAVLAWCTLLLFTAGCMDRDPAAPLSGDPLHTHEVATVLHGTGTATIDGRFSEAEWGNAAQVSFQAALAGGGTTTVRAYLQNDATHFQVALVSDQPFSNPNDVARVLIGTTDLDAFGILGGTGQDWYCSSPDDCHVDAVNNAVAARGPVQGGGSAFEMQRPLTGDGSSQDVTLSAGQTVQLRFQFIPNGAATTLHPGGTSPPLEFRISGNTVANDPNKPDVVVTVETAATVTIRNIDVDPAVDPNGFLVKLAQLEQDGKYRARFLDLEAGTRWVGTAGNKTIATRLEHLVWPPEDPGYTPPGGLPEQQGAVYSEDAALPSPSRPLTWENYLAATEHAIALLGANGGAPAEVREWEIEFQGPGRSAQCTVEGNGGVVYAMQIAPADPRVPPFASNQPPPALGLTYAPRSDCSLSGLPPGETLVLQSRDEDGGESTGLLCATCSSATLFQQSALLASTMLIDPRGDASQVDLLTLTYGEVEGSGGEPSGTFSLLTTFQGWNAKKKEAEVQLEIILDQGLASEQTIMVTATYGAGKRNDPATRWRITDVQPSHQGSRVQLGASDFNALTLEGGVEILILNWGGITTAHIRVRANLSDSGTDNLPDAGYAIWPDASGGSFTVSF